jgi:hypothetical protein
MNAQKHTSCYRAILRYSRPPNTEALRQASYGVVIVSHRPDKVRSVDRVIEMHALESAPTAAA